MMFLELNDIMFFVKSVKCPSPTLNILDYVSFSNSKTRSSSFNKLKDTFCCSSLSHHCYFNRLPRLWNSLPSIDLDQSLDTIKSKLKHFFWNHFLILSVATSTVFCFISIIIYFHANLFFCVCLCTIKKGRTPNDAN